MVIDGGVFEDAHVAVEEDEIDFAFGRLFGIVAVGVERLERSNVLLTDPNGVEIEVFEKQK